MMIAESMREEKTYGVASIDNLPFKHAANGTLVLEIVVENETESGIYIPDSVKEKMAVDVRSAKGLKWFKVLAVAPNLYPVDPNEPHEIPKAGDYVTLKNGEKVVAFIQDNIFYGIIEWHQVMLVK
jgi:co-chaperonin GroES (HSP10)